MTSVTPRTARVKLLTEGESFGNVGPVTRALLDALVASVSAEADVPVVQAPCSATRLGRVLSAEVREMQPAELWAHVEFGAAVDLYKVASALGYGLTVMYLSDARDPLTGAAAGRRLLSVFPRSADSPHPKGVTVEWPPSGAWLDEQAVEVFNRALRGPVLPEFRTGEDRRRFGIEHAGPSIEREERMIKALYVTYGAARPWANVDAETRVLFRRMARAAIAENDMEA